MARQEPLSASLQSGAQASDPARKDTELGETVLTPQETLPAEASAAAGAEEAPGKWVGRSLGKYLVTEVLGKGGMGVVLKARDPLIERDVAIKVLSAELSTDEKLRGRFLAEARAAGQLNHPHVTSIYEIGQEGETYFLVMEYLAEGNLSDRLASMGPLPVLEATQAMVDACRGIAAAHAVGLIHRDVKPANLMRSADGSVKVSDFGLAKATAAASGQFTQAGMVIGTPFFMSPEQCQGAPVDARSDIYSLGATYYTLLTAANPYEDSTSIPQLMYAHCHGPIPDPRQIVKTTPPACARIIAKAMAKAPGERYPSVEEMLADLQLVCATLSGQTIAALPSESGSHPPIDGQLAKAREPASRSWAMPLAGSVLLLLIAGALLWWRPWLTPDGAPDSQTDAAATGAAVPSGEPIKIGVLHSLSGTMSNSEMVVVDATLFAIDEINQSGGVLGRPLTAVVADGRSDPEIFAREAERLIAEERVATVFGCWTSAARKTVKPIFEEHDNLLVYPLQYEGLEASPNVIYMGPAPNQQILPAVDWAVNTLGKRRFFLVGSDYVFPRTAHEIIKDAVQRLGAQVVGEMYIPLGSADAGTLVEAIAAVQPDMILNTINGDSNTAFFRALRAADISSEACPTMSFSVGEQELRSLDIRDVESDYAAWTYFESVNSPENREFLEKFHKMYPQRAVTDPMEAAYAGVKLWAAAANEAASLEPAKIRRAMLNRRLTAPGGEIRIDPDTQHCFKTCRIGQITAAGHFQIVWESPQPIRPDPFPDSRTATQWAGFLHDLYTSWGNRWSAP